MTKTSLSYRVVELPPAQRGTRNYLDLYWWKHSIYGLLEVDVTRARQRIEEHKAQTGEALSFTGYLAFCLARAVDEDKSVQAYLKGRRHLVVFDDVDVFLPVDRELGGAHAAIRAAPKGLGRGGGCCLGDPGDLPAGIVNLDDQPGIPLVT